MDCRTYLVLGRFALFPAAIAAYNRAVAYHGWHTYGCYLDVEVAG